MKKTNLKESNLEVLNVNEIKNVCGGAGVECAVEDLEESRN